MVTGAGEGDVGELSAAAVGEVVGAVAGRTLFAVHGHGPVRGVAIALVAFGALVAVAVPSGILLGAAFVLLFSGSS